MGFFLTVMGWLGETVTKSLIDKVWDKMKELGSRGGDVGECGVGNALSDLKISLTKIQPTMTKAENMLIKDENLRQNVNELLVQFKDAAYDAEDLLDKFQFQKLQQKIKQQGNEASHQMKKRKVGDDHDDVNEIKKIQEKLDNISTDMEKLLGSDNKRNMQMINEINRVTGPAPVETQVFGRDNELNELMRFLLQKDQGEPGSGSSSNISVLTVTGMGGVGKTTLAQEAYNDKRVEKDFNPRIWVCVSEDFSVERLTKEIIESATKQKCDLSNFGALQEDLKQKITSKKFLLVLDDVWNEDWGKWDKLCAPLRSGGIGSKILVTTRNVKIANMVGSVNQIHLDGLDDDNSWAFFKKCAFGSQDSRDHPRLEAIAKEMVPKLKGLPLAARTLGGLLNMNTNEQHWKTIMDSEIWKLPQEENGVLLVLQLSYQYLPAHLKRCFAFCSLYPKDYEFDEHELVRIWMAEGFFPAQESITMEDFGSGCIQELVSRSFFQKSTRYLVSRSFFQKSTRYPDIYVMHDLIHDLAQLISQGETYRQEHDKKLGIPTMLHHLNIMTTKDDKVLRRMMEIHDFSKLRTLMYQWQDSPTNSFLTWELFNRLRSINSPMNSILTCGLFNRLRSIRTLILNECGLTEFPESIGAFIHLRYLDISRNKKIRKLPNSLFKHYNLQALILKDCNLYELPESIGDLIYLRYLNISWNVNLKRLPESLCRLSNLQTLILYGCRRLLSLPQGMSRLINLRKLDAKDDLVSEIIGVGKLTSLQSLSIFKVGKEHGLEELSGLTQLHGRLTITSLENVESKEEAIAAKLQSKLHLDELMLQWTSDQDNGAFSDSEEEVLEHLQPNSTLKRLTINGYSGARSPSWLEAETLPELDTLILKDCRRLLEGLPVAKLITQELRGSTVSNWLRLSVLEIHNCPLLKRLPLLPPSLTTLTLHQVGLTEFPGIQEEMGGSSSNIASIFPLEVWIRKCPNLTSLDQIKCFPSLSVLEINNCPLPTRLPPLPPSLKNLRLIQVGLTELRGISGSSSNMTFSRLLIKICDCPNLTSLGQIECFPSLSVLEINNCPLLKRLPPLPPSLTTLTLHQVGLTEFPGIQEGMGGNSSNIASVSPLVVRISKCPNLTSLDRIECFPCLESLHIEDCPLLTRLPPLPPSLKKLELIQVGLTELPGFGGSSSNIASVSPLVVRISKCPNLTSLDLIECFPCLKSLDIEDCPLLTRLPPLPPSLECLRLIQVGLTEIRGIGGSSHNIATVSLSVLEIRKCASLTNLGRIECSPCLSTIVIDNCPLLAGLSPLPPSLMRLILIQVGLTELPGIGGSSNNIITTVVSLLRLLRIEECSNMISLEQGLLSYNLPKLEVISVTNCGELLRMPVKKFKEFTNLTWLEIVNCPKLMSMAHDDDIHLLLPPSIQRLKLSNCGKVDKSLPGCLFNLTTLTRLELCGCPHFASFPREPLLHLERLETLHLLNCSELGSIAGVGVLKSLKTLKIHGCPKLQPNEGDEQGKNISSLIKYVIDNTALLKLSPFRNMLSSIIFLKIKSSLEVNMFEGEDQELLRSLTSLEYLIFHNCKNLQSLPTELHALRSLNLLKVDDCTQIQSLPEKGLPISLTDLHFNNCHCMLEKQLEEHLAKMKNSGRFCGSVPWKYRSFKNNSLVEDLMCWAKFNIEDR